MQRCFFSLGIETFFFGIFGIFGIFGMKFENLGRGEKHFGGAGVLFFIPTVCLWTDDCEVHIYTPADCTASMIVKPSRLHGCATVPPYRVSASRKYEERAFHNKIY